MYLETITEFFYKRASDRIRMKVEHSNLKHAQIYKPDHKQISRIINNKRTKNNPFLICDAVISSSYIDEETGCYINCGLLKKLDFENKKEILWGTDQEITSYMFELFSLLWAEVSDANSPYLIDTDLYLCDYVPYAKYRTYWNILFSPDNIYPAIAYGIYEDTVIAEIEPARNNAFHYLYNRCKNDFYNIFIKFANSTSSFHKLDKTFQSSFIEELFIPLLNSYKPTESSLGLRVQNLINADLSMCASMVFCTNDKSNSYLKPLINASSNYILALEQIQKMIYHENAEE